MKFRYQVGAMLATMVSTTAPIASAQTDPQLPENVTICPTVASLWSGSRDDVAQIESVSVPDSFRSLYFGDPCARFSLVKSALIDWNMVPSGSSGR